jgi:iron complex outermembrane receptor protein
MKKGFLFAASLVLATSLLQAQTVLDSVVITATRANNKIPVAQTTIYQQQIEEERLGKEMPYLLEMLPSVVSYSDNGTTVGSTSFRIRGTDASRTNISLNGVPLNDAESQAVFWVNIPDLGAISKSLQMQRGVGTSPFGSSAFGGLLNIETRDTPRLPEAAFEGSYGSFNTWNVAARAATGLLKDALAFDARYEYVSSDGYLERSGLWQQTLYMNGRWQGKTHLLKASVLYGEQHSLLTFDGVPADSLATNRRFNASGWDGNQRFYPNETDNYQQLHAHLHYTQQLGRHWKGNLTAFYTKGRGYYEQYKYATSLSKYGIDPQVINGNTYKKSDLIRQKGLDNDFFGLNLSALYEATRLHLILGAGASRYSGDHIGKVLWTQYNEGALPYNRNWYDNTGVKDEYSLFAKASFDLLPALSVFADAQLRGIRFNMHGMDDDFYEKPQWGMLDTTYHWLFFNPKIGLTYSPNTRHTAFASLAVGQREPNRSDLKDADRNGLRNPARAERLLDWELGYTFRPDFGRFSLGLYYMDYHNQIVATGRLNDAYRPIMENVPDSYRMGLEIMAAVRPLQALQIEANLTLSRNKLRNYTNYLIQYDENWNESFRPTFYPETTIAYSPSVVGAAALRWYPLSGLALALTGKYVSRQFIDNTASTTRSIDPYFVANLTANYDFALGKKLNGFVQLAINNLFNAQYCTSAYVYDSSAATDGSPDYYDLRYFPQAGINFMVKTGWKF